MKEWKEIEEDLCRVSDAIYIGHLMAMESLNSNNIQLRISAAYFAMSSACFTLYQETIKYAVDCELVSPKNLAGFISFYIALIRDLRSVHVLYVNGYMAQAIPMLRGIFERLECMGAIFNGLSTFVEMFQFDNLQHISPQTDLSKVFKKGEDARVKARLRLWEGLSKQANIQLKNSKLFSHQQVHFGLLSQTEALIDVKNGDFSLLPPMPHQPIQIAFHSYSIQCNLLFIKLLCFLQLKDTPFDNELQNKWQICNDAMVHMAINMQSEENQDIGKYFMEFVNDRFDFSPDTHFYSKEYW